MSNQESRDGRSSHHIRRTNKTMDRRRHSHIIKDNSSKHTHKTLPTHHRRLRATSRTDRSCKRQVLGRHGQTSRRQRAQHPNDNRRRLQRQTAHQRSRRGTTHRKAHIWRRRAGLQQSSTRYQGQPTTIHYLATLTPTHSTEHEIPKTGEKLATYREIGTIGCEDPETHRNLYAQLDYIITAKRWQNMITDVEVSRKIALDTDHYPLVATARIKMRKVKKKEAEGKPIFSNKEQQQAYQTTVKDKVDELLQTQEVEWIDLEAIIKEAADEAFEQTANTYQRLHIRRHLEKDTGATADRQQTAGPPAGRPGGKNRRLPRTDKNPHTNYQESSKARQRRILLQES